MFVDTHTHIYCEEFDQCRDAVISRAFQAGVNRLLLPAIDGDTYQRQWDLAVAYPDTMYQMMGLHPTSVSDDYESQLSLAHDWLYNNPDSYVGVGEIGLDFYWDTSYRDQQMSALRHQLRWADELNKPVALHVRNAYGELFDLLDDINKPVWKGVLHCFGGTLDQAQVALEMGFCLGIGGVLTYKKSLLPDIVKKIPLSGIVLETDAPYLAPVPHRGKQNEPSFLPDVARCLAGIKDITLEEVARQTTENAMELFHLV
ncbi:MAG: TatD family hydrolase [Bacteroidales bacterium]|nr:TatD family hydrolase [Candidatus Colimorpha onthohippi]